MKIKGTVLFDEHQKGPSPLFARRCYFFLVAVFFAAVFFAVVFFAPQVLPVLPGLHAIASSFHLQQYNNRNNVPWRRCRLCHTAGIGHYVYIGGTVEKISCKAIFAIPACRESVRTFLKRMFRTSQQ
jgi:hypothetical protein